MNKKIHEIGSLKVLLNLLLQMVKAQRIITKSKHSKASKIVNKHLAAFLNEKKVN